MAQDYLDLINILQFVTFSNNICFIGYEMHQLKEYSLYEVACSLLPNYYRIMEQFHLPYYITYLNACSGLLIYNCVRSQLNFRKLINIHITFYEPSKQSPTKLNIKDKRHFI